MAHSKYCKKIFKPNHPRSNSIGQIKEVIVIIENILGKPLSLKGVVHHIDKNKGNNSNTNLIACENDNYHKLIHRRERALKACGHVNWRKCWLCKQYDDPKNLYIDKWHICHRKCKNAYINKLKRSKRIKINLDKRLPLLALLTQKEGL